MHIILAVRLHAFPLLLFPLQTFLVLLGGFRSPRQVRGHKELLLFILFFFFGFLRELRRNCAWLAVRRQRRYAVQKPEAAKIGTS